MERKTLQNCIGGKYNLPIVCSKCRFFSTTGLAAEVKWVHHQVSDSSSHWSRGGQWTALSWMELWHSAEHANI